MEARMPQTDDRITWLLDAQTPSIIYQTLKDLRSARSSASEIRAAKARVMSAGAVPAILSRQSQGGKWKIDKGYYGPKFYSTHWSMMLLMELGVDGRDRRFGRGAEYMLDVTREEARKNLDRKIPDWSCFWGNLLRYALHAGLQDDPRVESLARYLSLALNDGSCACRLTGGNACAWGVVRTLWGLAALPEKCRTKETDRAIRKGIKFLLEDNRLVTADYPVRPKSRINPLWFKLSFPLFYHADILFTLRVLDELDELDHRGTREALDWLEARRGPDGRWKGTSPFRTRTWREMGAPEETHRWVTLQALRILQHAGRQA
jgi:hypothetical protein